MWDECNCEVIQTFFGIAFLCDWNENWPFPVLGHCWVFQNCWHIECSTFITSSFRIWNSSAGIPLPPPALFVVMLPKTHLSSHSRMSDSRWVITPVWLTGSLRCFLYSSVYPCHLFLISSASVSIDTISVLYCDHLCMKCPLGIFYFLEDISSISHFVVSLYLISLIAEEGFLISPC